MKHHARIGVSVLLAAVLLAACAEDTPAPVGDPPILTGLDPLPKEIATIALSPTTTPVLVGGQPVDVMQPTQTPAPPRPTATLTPYVGIYLGEPTAEGGGAAPNTIPTLAPFILGPGTGGVVVGGVVGGEPGGACGIPVAVTFANAYNANATVQQRLGCPMNGGAFLSLMATQSFERGIMYWRGDTRLIYTLASSGQFWQVPDGWQEGMPADDPAYSPPGGLVQPVRGFGLVWRSNQAIRDALGWGTQSEAAYSGFWQDFERGAMLVGSNNLVYAIFTAEGQHSGPLSP